MNDKNVKINASPTKEFFIHMLVKDLDLYQAISDLLDNSIDGAKRLRKDENYKDLFVKIEVNKESFSIFDNCGGISIDVARDYAFRFGRAPGTPGTDYSIGRFGVGMKRAIFKMGKSFEIESITNTTKFVVKQDIERWEEDADSWDFAFDEIDDAYSLQDNEVPGTKITVTNLYEGISDEFSLDRYIIRLRGELSTDHQISLQKGLEIQLNGELIKSEPLKLLSSPKITPAYKEIIKDNNEVSVKIYVGITKELDSKSKLEPSKAGWNIFCNDRLILKSDKSHLTGWGRENSNPSFHNDFARFRGFVFFESQKPELLPWNTTKSGIDSDLPTYRAVKQEMTKLMKPAINLLNEVSREKRNSESENLTPLEELIYEGTLEEIKRINIESGVSIGWGRANHQPK